MRLSCLQTNPQQNCEENVEYIFEQARLAKKNNSELVVFPEMFTLMGDVNRVKTASRIHESTFASIQALAKELNLSIVAGSHSEVVEGDTNKVYNTSITYDNCGEIISIYRKLHLFNLKDEQGNKIYCESDEFAEGQPPNIYNLHSDGEVWKSCTIICYDVRFPEIIRNLKENIDILFVPAAFTWQTGQDHWEILLRARAIENQCYVVACNQTGFYSNNKKRNYGNSMIIDPWGNIIARLGEESGILSATLSKKKIIESRQRLPALSDRKIH